jgi:hypothetical protein
MEADFVAYSMGIVAYMMFYWECDSTTVLGHYIGSSLSMVLSRRQSKWEINAMSQVGSFLESQAKVAGPVKSHSKEWLD